MSLTRDQERWAEAHTVLDLHGDFVFTFIAERIIDLAREGDQDGVDRWREIADRVGRLQRGTLQ
ncbi:DUF6961 family protein [Sphingomonas oligophenolica]|uniref:Uncharacterized protein n=1 Tax=Sphingomonas oligophenolica TaxID=301154 RepID=A0A502CNA9_9SPHN|nr:hypothetical protein [Sphingomonas oligophenolica]TPG13171.1 hypothetical protein EAH84_07160 [Sphingomonas oligophenolica]